MNALIPLDFEHEQALDSLCERAVPTFMRPTVKDLLLSNPPYAPYHNRVHSLTTAEEAVSWHEEEFPVPYDDLPPRLQSERTGLVCAGISHDIDNLKPLSGDMMSEEERSANAAFRIIMGSVDKRQDSRAMQLQKLEIAGFTARVILSTHPTTSLFSHEKKLIPASDQQAAPLVVPNNTSEQKLMQHFNIADTTNMFQAEEVTLNASARLYIEFLMMTNPDGLTGITTLGEAIKNNAAGLPDWSYGARQYLCLLARNKGIDYRGRIDLIKADNIIDVNSGSDEEIYPNQETMTALSSRAVLIG